MVTGAVATSYDLPNYLGQLFQKFEKPNSVLRLIGGLTGGLQLVTTRRFSMGVDYVLPAADSTGKLEGAAPVLKEQDLENVDSILQIFQEGYGLTYSRQSAVGEISGIAAIPGAGNGELVVPGTMEWQRLRAIERVQRNVNLTFLRGAYQSPANNTTARQARGVRSAVVTHVFNNSAQPGTGRALSKTILENALQTMAGNSAFMIGDEIYALCSLAQYSALADLYVQTGTNAQIMIPNEATVAGVAITRLRTKFATVNLVYEPDMAAGEILLFQPKYCRVKAMAIVSNGLNKGVFFSEPLSKVGSSDTEQMYGEFGLDYRNEIFHGVITDLS